MNWTRIRTKKEGFSCLSLMMFLPLICLLFFSISFSSYLIQFKTKMRSVCIQETLMFQKKLVKNEMTLFQLNPIALSLRNLLIMKKTQLVAALATKNLTLAAQIQLEINSIRKRQEILDLRQRQIIQITQQQMQIDKLSILHKLNQISENSKSVWRLYFKSFTNLRIFKNSQFSIKPDSPDIAPVYELTNNYIEAQKMAFKWHHFYKTTHDNQKLIKEKNELIMSCGSYAIKKGAEWNFLINVDKF